MEKLADFAQLIAQEQIVIPVWEILLLLLIAVLCLILRGSRLSLMLTYIFTLHMSWSFMKMHFGYAALITFAVFAVIVLILGFYSLLTERD
ncbi:MAG: hypothetical protein AB7E95_03090 [Kiritimatiellales bacterium]